MRPSAPCAATCSPACACPYAPTSPDTGRDGSGGGDVHPGRAGPGLPSRKPSPRLDLLTCGERETLSLVGRGLSNAEVAAALVVGEHTVRTHVGNVFAKPARKDRAQAVVAAYESGLIFRTAERP
ncbi:helix-turn-helix transcriptional regulator [Nonomuraea sp. NPDC050202]|uniref:response regulator transcription factor n=1 Tax=Nonomuraea sp. NPDC050202 TaxID=3155035 RepID=UPI0033E77A17